MAIQELMHTIGVLDPADPRTKGVVKHIGVLVEAMPAHRTFAPDADVLAWAALLSGILCRLQGARRMRGFVPFAIASYSCRRRSSASRCLRSISPLSTICCS
jgi:hypothetical protein